MTLGEAQLFHLWVRALKTSCCVEVCRLLIYNIVNVLEFCSECCWLKSLKYLIKNVHCNVSSALLQ